MDDPCLLVQREMSELFQCAQVGEYVRIRTPYLYPDGDYIDLFLSSSGEVATLSDLGETTRWLRMQTVTPRRSPKQAQLIQDICLNHGVEFYRGMLQVRYRPGENFAATVVRLAQAALRTADLWFTFRARAVESVSDEVADLLVDRRVAFERDERLPGRSGRSWLVNFHTRTSQRSSLVIAIATGSRSAAHRITEHVLATWVDLSHLKVGPEALRFVSLFDDTSDVWATEDFRLLEDQSSIARLSDPDEFVGMLEAS